MKSLTILAAAAATLATASVADARGQGRIGRPGLDNPVPPNCPLVVTFGSYGPGIDRPTLERVDQLLARDRTVTNVTRHRWGREGEVSLCVRARGQSDLVRIANRIRAALPARTRGPVTVENRARRW